MKKQTNNKTVEAIAHYTEEQRKHHEELFNENKPKNLLQEITHESGIKINDLVIVKNGCGINVGPYKVLGFKEENGKQYMYLDWDCYWFPKELSYLIVIIKVITVR